MCARTELIDEVLLLVRTVPDDGAERDLWLRRHRRPTSPPLATTVNDDLAATLARASVRTEAFVTIVVPETRLGREAREAGCGTQSSAITPRGRLAARRASAASTRGHWPSATNWVSPTLLTWAL